MNFDKKANVLLVHNDEKWFYAIIVRVNNKYIPYLVFKPDKNMTHHKSHDAKVMCLLHNWVVSSEQEHDFKREEQQLKSILHEQDRWRKLRDTMTLVTTPCHTSP